MPRKARIDAPGALHHIIGRGIERRKIFLDDVDRGNFVQRLGMISSDTGKGTELGISETSAGRKMNLSQSAIMLRDMLRIHCFKSRGITIIIMASAEVHRKVVYCESYNSM